MNTRLLKQIITNHHAQEEKKRKIALRRKIKKMKRAWRIKWHRQKHGEPYNPFGRNFGIMSFPYQSNLNFYDVRHKLIENQMEREERNELLKIRQKNGYKRVMEV